MRPILRCLGRTGKAKAMTDGIAVAEELLDELLVATATGAAFSVSCNLKPRPMTTRVPTESKYSGVPLTQDAPLLMSGSP